MNLSFGRHEWNLQKKKKKACLKIRLASFVKKKLKQTEL